VHVLDGLSWQFENLWQSCRSQVWDIQAQRGIGCFYTIAVGFLSLETRNPQVLQNLGRLSLFECELRLASRLFLRFRPVLGFGSLADLIFFASNFHLEHYFAWLHVIDAQQIFSTQLIFLAPPAHCLPIPCLHLSRLTWLIVFSYQSLSISSTYILYANMRR